MDQELMGKNIREWSKFDMELIEFVKQNPILYDKDNSFTQLKWELWREIARTLETTSTQCMQRWRQIQETYKKFLKPAYTIIPKSSKYLDGRLFFLGIPYSLEDDENSNEDIISLSETPCIKPIVVTKEKIEEIMTMKSKEKNTVDLAELQTELVDETFEEEVNIVADIDMETPTPTRHLNINTDVISTIAKIIPDADDDVLSKTFLDHATLPTEHNVFYGKKPLEKVSNINSLPVVYSLKKNIQKKTTPLSKATESNAMKSIKANFKLNHHEMSTTEFFQQMGEYAAVHLPEEKQKTLRSMLWSLITAEELELLRED